MYTRLAMLLKRRIADIKVKEAKRRRHCNSTDIRVLLGWLSLVSGQQTFTYRLWFLALPICHMKNFDPTPMS